jgi:hypothetical protein
MTNPERINILMDLVSKIWEKHPDTRFNQLIHSLQFDFYQETKRGTVCHAYTINPIGQLEAHEWAIDLFNVEDDLFIEFLERKLKK